ncbi:hypothetical protein DFH27DRAFT_526167 [Peziza echinospora]|nr:hypothetical protein DFH27DRAFT_526167 [Peziza echinospora]
MDCLISDGMPALHAKLISRLTKFKPTYEMSAPMPPPGTSPSNPSPNPPTNPPGTAPSNPSPNPPPGGQPGTAPSNPTGSGSGGDSSAPSNPRQQGGDAMDIDTDAMEIDTDAMEIDTDDMHDADNMDIDTDSTIASRPRGGEYLDASMFGRPAKKRKI